MKKTFSSLLALMLTLNIFAQNPQVKVQQGTLEGFDNSGVKTFLGIPFAEAPVGKLRWQAPQPKQAWAGVRDAKEFGDDPMQLPVFGDMGFKAKKKSEDCLYLNVWTPSKTMKEGLATLIYFNGGGLMAGSGSEPRYAGDALARRGIICVTANYREGIFGNLSLPELTKEQGHSGNYAFLDQAAAIQWVHDNIASFGGDPNKITIVGESAGSYSVSVLMASPLSKNLISKAMGSSGAFMSKKSVSTQKEAEAAGLKWVKEKVGKTKLKDLRAMPAEELQKLAGAGGMANVVIDNYFMKESPIDVYAKGEQAQVPLLVGGNSMELPPLVFTKGKASLAAVKEALTPEYGDQAEHLMKLYGLNTDDDVLDEPGALFSSDYFIQFDTWKWTDMMKKTSSQPVYRYLFCQPRPEMREKGLKAELAGGVSKADPNAPKPVEMRFKGAVHSADIEYAMGNLATNHVYDWTPDDYLASEQFQQYYVNFVKTGNPNGLGLVEWIPINGQAVAPVLQLGAHSFMKASKQMEDRYAWMDNFKNNKK